MPPKKKS